MTKEVELFKFGVEDVRIVKIEEEPWFVAKDVCEVLEIKNYRDAVTKLEDDERMVSLIPTPSNGGESDVNLVSESGLYALIFQSRKPSAKLFARWVTHEILPQIRKTGKYVGNTEKHLTPVRLERRVWGSDLDININVHVHKGVDANTHKQLEVATTEYVNNVIGLTEGLQYNYWDE